MSNFDVIEMERVSFGDSHVIQPPTLVSEGQQRQILQDKTHWTTGPEDVAQGPVTAAMGTVSPHGPRATQQKLAGKWSLFD